MNPFALPVQTPAEPDSELATLTAALMQSRQTILPKRLIAPGPDASQLAMILNAAASAPDHGQLLPWRFAVQYKVAIKNKYDGYYSDLFAHCG